MLDTNSRKTKRRRRRQNNERQEAPLLMTKNLRDMYQTEPRPDILCVQETWLRPHLDYIIPGHISARSDRVYNTSIVFRRLPSPADMEYVIIE